MIQTITGPQFASTFCLNPKQFIWFLGAGTSASAGIPTGYAMIQDFKKRLFCQISGVNPREVDANDPLWQNRIEFFLKTRNLLPPKNDPAEYATSFESIYPTAKERRLYIESAIKKGTPSFAHRVFASLITTKKIPLIFTTNFDNMIESSAVVTDQLITAENRANMTVAAIDNAGRAERCFSESSWPLLIKLHGDYQSDELKNTSDELKEQDTRLRDILVKACSRFGIIVAGYSGRDASVMKTLFDAMAQKGSFPGGMYWVARSSESILPQAMELLNAANLTKISTSIVESPTFDELAGDIVDIIDLPTELLRHVQESRPAPILRNVPLPRKEQSKFPILQCSAIPILTMPKVARRIEVNEAIRTDQARELLREAKIRKALAVSNGRDIVAYGSDKDLLRAFSPVGARLASTIELHPDIDSWALGLIYEALTKALCRLKPLLPRLRRRGHSIITAPSIPNEEKDRTDWRNALLKNLKDAYSSPLTGHVPACNFTYNEGIQIRIEQIVDQWWCVFEPFTHVEIPETADNYNYIKDWRRERWANRFNATWHSILSAWANIIAGDGATIHAIGLQNESGIDASFQLSPITAWSRPCHDHDYFLRV